MTEPNSPNTEESVVAVDDTIRPILYLLDTRDKSSSLIAFKIEATNLSFQKKNQGACI